MIGKTIHVVQGQHPYHGPDRMSAHTERRTAVKTAVEWTNIFLKAQGRPETATTRNWRHFYRQQPLVWITETVLKA